MANEEPPDANDAEAENLARIDRILAESETGAETEASPAASRRTFGMLALAALLSILVFAGVLTHFVG